MSTKLRVEPCEDGAKDCAGALPEPEDAALRWLPGRAPVMSDLRARLRALAVLGVPVLVSGEPGVGRGAAVRALHELSGEKVPLAPVSPPPCELPRERSAVVWMALESWPREAQDRWAAELRGSSPRVARLYAIAGPLLAAAVERGEVRRDLWARISRFRLELPPLRARAADLPMLARRALDEIAEPLRSKRCTLDSAAIETLQRRRWSGNLPELREVIVQAVAFATGSRIDRAGIERAIEAVIAAREDSLASRRAEKESAERAELVRLLALHHGNVAEIARQLGLTRGAVTYRLRKYGLVR